jgi:hypothetical protein
MFKWTGNFGGLLKGVWNKNPPGFIHLASLQKAQKAEIYFPGFEMSLQQLAWGIYLAYPEREAGKQPAGSAR